MLNHMRKLIEKPCRICGGPVVPTKRKDRQAYYYPRQCPQCFKKCRNEKLRKNRISIAIGGMSHPKAVSLFTERIVDRRGCKYVQIKVSPKGKWPYKHRWMMEQFLGRKLLRTELVHHINGDSLDNRYDNFHLVSHAQHNVIHCMIVSWSKNYYCCRLCNTSTREHEADGLCSLCYRRVKAKELGHWPKPKHNGRWSKNSDHCFQCHSTDRPHKAFGLCTRCYQRKKAEDRGCWL
jgi:hypothetical protein